MSRWETRSPKGVCWKRISSSCVFHIQNCDFQSRLGGVEACAPGKNYRERGDVDNCWSLLDYCYWVYLNVQNPFLLQLQVKDSRFEWTRDKMLVLREVTHADQGLYAIKMSSGFTDETVHLTVSGTIIFSICALLPLYLLYLWILIYYLYSALNTHNNNEKWEWWGINHRGLLKR